MTTSSSIPCPDCRADVAVGSTACPACGIRLTGPDAVRLWALDQQLARYAAERVQLIESLRRPAPAPHPGPGVMPNAYPSVSHPSVSGPSVSGPSVTGQQLLLGLGALLVLAAATFLGAVVWMVVGLWGQAILLVTLVALSAAGAVAATRRRLPAAAETGAVLASGLTVVGLWAAWSLDLGGLASVPPALYAALAAAFAGLVLLGFDRLVPRADGSGELRRILTYRPVASAALALSPWLLLVHVAPSGVALVLGLVAVAAVGVGLWWVAVRTLGTVASLPPALSAGAALLGAVVAGLVEGLDPTSPTRELSVLVTLLLLVGVAVVGLRRGRHDGDLAVHSAAVLAVPLLASLGWEVHWSVLLGACVVLALVAVGLALAPWNEGAEATTGHRAAQLLVAALGTVLVGSLAALHLADESQLVAAPFGHGGPDHRVVAGVAAVWVVASAVVALRLRSTSWLVLAHLMLAATLVLALLDSDTPTRTTAWVVASAVLAGLSALLETGWARFRLAWPAAGGGLLAFAAAFGFVALALALLGLDQPAQGLAVVAVGVIAYASSLVPGRIALAYVGSVVIATGTSMLAVEAGWDAVETFSWPLALLLATIGWRHWRQDRTARSRLTMGPALAVALVPSTLVAVGEGDSVRLALVSLAAVALLVGGLVVHLQAPVAIASGCLAYLAITQGGPYVAELPGWLTLGTAGLTLLAIGVSWERAVLAGRRGSAWFAQLR